MARYVNGKALHGLAQAYHWAISGLFGKKYADAAFESVDSYLNKATGNAMTNADKQKADYEDAIADENATVAYMRQKEFQENYLTPEAQLKSQAAGYDAIGLNRMMLGGSQPGASSSTAPVSSGGTADAGISSGLADIIGAMFKAKELKIAKSQSDADIRLKNAEALNKEISAKWADRQQEAEYQQKIATVNNLRANLPKILAETKHAEVLALYAPQLFDSQIAGNVAGAEKALAQADEARSRVSLNEAEIKELNAKTALHSKEMQEIDAKIMKIQQECITLGTQAALNDQMVNESMARVEKYREQIRQIGAEIGLTNKEIEHYEWNHSKDISNKLPFGISIHKEAFYSDYPDADSVVR